jgi:hypothetical protein
MMKEKAEAKEKSGQLTDANIGEQVLFIIFLLI